LATGPYEAVLFDFDGVLVDSEPVHLDCWLRALAPLGIHIYWETYCEEFIGIDDREMLATVCGRADPPVAFEDAWATYPLKKRLFEVRMHGTGIITDDVRTLIAQLRNRMKVAVVTSSAQSEVEPVLRSAGLLEELHTVVYGGDVERLKPAPDPYLLAAERLGVKRALVVEDSRAGLEAGRAAGFEVLHVQRQSDMVQLLTAALS
jgi:beta-phosphoglucomutase